MSGCGSESLFSILSLSWRMSGRAVLHDCQVNCNNIQTQEWHKSELGFMRYLMNYFVHTIFVGF